LTSCLKKVDELLRFHENVREAPTRSVGNVREVPVIYGGVREVTF
jgi:hypothetical protein